MARSRTVRSSLASSALLAFVACGGPFLLLPGGALDGDVAPAPARWDAVGDAGTAQLETNAADPYSVNVAYTVVDGRLYVNAGDTETRWARHIAGDPRVRLRVDGALYALRAERVTAAGEIASFAEAWTAQSIFRRDPRGLDAVWLFRMEPR